MGITAEKLEKRRRELILTLRESAHTLDGNPPAGITAADVMSGKDLSYPKCNYCEPDVGYECECCFAARIARDAAAFLEHCVQVIPDPPDGPDNCDPTTKPSDP